jgi:hypothetical protein
VHTIVGTDPFYNSNAGAIVIAKVKITRSYRAAKTKQIKSSAQNLPLVIITGNPTLLRSQTMANLTLLPSQTICLKMPFFESSSLCGASPKPTPRPISNMSAVLSLLLEGLILACFSEDDQMAVGLLCF